MLNGSIFTLDEDWSFCSFAVVVVVVVLSVVVVIVTDDYTKQHIWIAIIGIRQLEKLIALMYHIYLRICEVIRLPMSGSMTATIALMMSCYCSGSKTEINKCDFHYFEIRKVSVFTQLPRDWQESAHIAINW